MKKEARAMKPGAVPVSALLFIGSTIRRSLTFKYPVFFCSLEILQEYFYICVTFINLLRMTRFAERKKKWGTEMVFKSISLPENIIKKMKLLQEIYQDKYERKVSYGEIFERLFSPMALGNVDPGVYSSFASALKSRSEFDEVVKRPTRMPAGEIERREKGDGTGIPEETGKELQAVAEKEARCIEIVKAASPAPPTEKNWAKGEWFVNEG